MRKTNEKNNKGITLVALVITIIVMLILVAVTITVAVNGGLFDYARNAISQTRNALDKEQTLADSEVNINGLIYPSIDDYINGKYKIDVTELEKKLEQYKDVIGKTNVYTESTYNDFYNQYTKIQELVTLGKGTKEEVDEAIKSIDEKYSLLKNRTEPQFERMEISTDGEKIKLKIVLDDNWGEYYKITECGFLFKSTATAGSSLITMNTSGKTRIYFTFKPERSEYSTTKLPVDRAYKVTAYIKYINELGSTKYKYVEPNYNAVSVNNLTSSGTASWQPGIGWLHENH